MELGESVNNEKIRRVIFCSGQIYYDLLEYRIANNISDVVIIRCEQIAPFPYLQAQIECNKYANADIVWCQEEHRNQGAWPYMKSRLGMVIFSKITKIDGKRH